MDIYAQDDYVKVLTLPNIGEKIYFKSWHR